MPAGQNNCAYSIAGVSGATTYAWTVPPGATIVSGQGTTAIMVNYGLAAASGYVSVTPANGFGSSGTTASAGVTVNPVGTPTAITSGVTGTNLSLSWPADHLGWRLLVQTNQLNVGLSTNWFTWPNSTNWISVTIPILPANPSVFFRLVYP